MGKRSNSKPDHRRTTIANEAARIIQEHGLADYRSAKMKAIERLGLQLRGALPSNNEVEQALAERNRIFRRETHQEYLQELRAAALNIMYLLKPLQSRLVGPVLSGHATEHSTIDLHFFCDTCEEVSFQLGARGIKHRSVRNRQRLNRERIEYLPGYRFFSAGFEFSSTVFPERSRRHAPLSPVDGRPMQRATPREILSLLETMPTEADASASSAY